MPLNLKLSYVRSFWKHSLREISEVQESFQQVWTYGSLRFKGIVSDHGSTALSAIYIGYEIKITTNLGLSVSKIQNKNQNLSKTKTKKGKKTKVKKKKK